MKNHIASLCIALLLACNSSNAQITFEHSYPESSAYPMFVQKFSAIGHKYWNQTQVGKTILLRFYNLDHSLYKSFSLTPDDTNYRASMAPIAISDHLFNSNDKIEVLWVQIWAGGSPSRPSKQKITDEDGTVIFEKDSALTGNIHNTSQGFKLILTRVNSNMYRSEVYSLPGSIPLLAKPTAGKSQDIADAFPNPAAERVVIPYALPDGQERGNIVFTDLHGKEVRRFTVTNQFNTLELTNELGTGTYLYQLQTDQTLSTAKKLIIIK